MNVSRRELAVAVIAPLVDRLIAEKVIPKPEPKRVVGISFEDRVRVSDGFSVLGWPELQTFLSKTLGLDLTEDLQRSAKAKIVCPNNVMHVRIDVTEEKTLVTVDYYDRPTLFHEYSKSGIGVYQDKNFIALCDRMGFWREAYTIEFVLDFAEGERPKIIQTYQLMEPKN